MSRIQYHDVASSNIRALGFEKGVGYVEFTGGRRFAYKMTKTLFTQMEQAKSIGSFFAANVKKICPVVWSGHCCDNSPCKSDAMLLGTVPGLPQFRVCEPCSKNPRFAEVVFTAIPEEKKP